ncbi:MAG: CsgG/HfaB family protein [Smithellaceae bacterium]
MKPGRIIFFVTIALLCISCAGARQAGQDDSTGFLSISGTIQEIKNKEVIVTLKLPETKTTTGSPIGEITQQIVRKSLLLEGMKTEVNGKPAIIRELRGNTARIEVENAADYQTDKSINISVPKKTLAVVDFEVIKGTQREVGRVTLEGLTSALIDSGQFTVLERSKLKTVMNELELSLSGLSKDSPDKVSGKLLIADLILTGTLSESMGEWDINLRLINVRTGQALSAVTMKTTLFKPSELRDAGSWNEDFESASADPSWKLGYRRHKQTGDHARISIDRQSGTDDSKKSLRIDFKFTDAEEPFFASAENSKKRNLTLYNGIEFYIRGSEKLSGQVGLLTSSQEDANKIDKWFGSVEIDTKWEKCRIPFDKMILARRWIKQGAARYGASPGDQIMRLHRIEAVEFGIDSQKNPTTEGTVWIDNIRFYRD